MYQRRCAGDRVASFHHLKAAFEKVWGLPPAPAAQLNLALKDALLATCKTCHDRGWIAGEDNTEKPCTCEAGQALKKANQ